MTHMTSRALISAGGKGSTRLCAGARKPTESNLKDVNSPKFCAFNPPTNVRQSVEFWLLLAAKAQPQRGCILQPNVAVAATLGNDKDGSSQPQRGCACCERRKYPFSCMPP